MTCEFLYIPGSDTNPVIQLATPLARGRIAKGYGTITFWEATTGAKFHLGQRWSGKHRGVSVKMKIMKVFKYMSHI